MINLRNNKLLKNASWLIGAKIAQAVMQLAISMMTARSCGPYDFGVLNSAE